jgi:indole-3-acetate monooxygenase
MTFKIDNDLLKVASELGPIIRKHADEAERERRPSRAMMDALTEAGLQRMYLPESLGGKETDPVTYSRVAEIISGFDSVAGWALQVGNSVGWWCARFPDKGVEEIYSDGPDALIAGAFHPPQPAVEVDGGYRVSGRAALASNIHDADWVFLTGMVMDGDEPRMVNGAPKFVQLIFRADEAKIIDTRDALGMRGTDSNDVAVDDLFVPASRTFAVIPEFEPGPHYQSPLYRFPGVGHLLTIFVPVILAIGREAITELRKLALKKMPFGSTRELKERNKTQSTLAQAEAMLRSARLFYFNTINECWELTKASQPTTLEHHADLMLAGTHAANTAAKVADMMHGLAGTSGIYTASRLERLFRDAQTLRHHGFISTSRYETVGQVYLDVPPEFAFIHF